MEGYKIYSQDKIIPDTWYPLKPVSKTIERIAEFLCHFDVVEIIIHYLGNTLPLEITLDISTHLPDVLTSIVLEYTKGLDVITKVCSIVDQTFKFDPDDLLCFNPWSRIFDDYIYNGHFYLGRVTYIEKTINNLLRNGLVVKTITSGYRILCIHEGPICLYLETWNGDSLSLNVQGFNGKTINNSIQNLLPVEFEA